jgi:hypothetical protein
MPTHGKSKYNKRMQVVYAEVEQRWERKEKQVISYSRLEYRNQKSI